MRRKTAVPELSEEFAYSLCIPQHISDGGKAVRSVSRVILKGQGFLDIDDRVDPESGKPFIEPPVDHVIDLFPDLRILPVEIRLLFMEYMEIVFILMSRELFPDRTAKVRSPVAGELPILDRLYIEIFPILSIRILACPSEPLMFIRTMVDDQIHDNVHVTLFRFGEQTVHVVHRPETRVNVPVIRNVIPLVSKRRGVDRREPYDIYAELLQLI